MTCYFHHLCDTCKNTCKTFAGMIQCPDYDPDQFLIRQKQLEAEKEKNKIGQESNHEKATFLLEVSRVDGTYH